MSCISGRFFTAWATREPTPAVGQLTFSRPKRETLSFRIYLCSLRQSYVIQPNRLYTPGARNLRSHLRISTRTPALKDLFQQGEKMYFGWHHWLDGRESQWTPGVGDGQGGLACCDSWGRKEWDTTERLIWSDLIWWYGIQPLYWSILPTFQIEHLNIRIKYLKSITIQ